MRAPCSACRKEVQVRRDGLAKAHKDAREGVSRPDTRSRWCDGSHRPTIPPTTQDEDHG